jgi:hypothetical protein
MVWGICIDCNTFFPNCCSCSNSSVCLKCIDGYTLVNNSCPAACSSLIA